MALCKAHANCGSTGPRWWPRPEPRTPHSGPWGTHSPGSAWKTDCWVVGWPHSLDRVLSSSASFTPPFNLDLNERFWCSRQHSTGGLLGAFWAGAWRATRSPTHILRLGRGRQKGYRKVTLWPGIEFLGHRTVSGPYKKVEEALLRAFYVKLPM